MDLSHSDDCCLWIYIRVVEAVFWAGRTRSKSVEYSKHLSRATTTDSSFCLHHWTFSGRALFRQILLRYLRKSLPTWLSVFLVGLAFALTHMHSLSLSEWVGAVGYLGGGLAFSIIYVKEKENVYYPLLVHMLGNSLSFIILAIGSM